MNSKLVSKVGIVLVAIVLGVNSMLLAASATGSPASHSLSVGIGQFFKLALSESAVNLGNDVDPDDGTVEQVGALTVTMKNNINQDLYLQTYISGDLAGTAGGSISAASLSFRGGDVGSYTAFSTTPQTVKTYATGSSRGVKTVDMDYSLSLSWDTAADDYSATVYYTLTDTI